VKLSVGKADDLRQFRDKGFDVVFTDAVLIYVGPDKIKKVVKEMLRVARKALIFFEYYDFDSGSNPLGIYAGHWKRDYAMLLREFLPKDKIMVTRLPEELWADEKWQKCGAVIEAAA
jgi:ubiquinone/menaquinone biosynthesis C-methylase UbiE